MEPTLPLSTRIGYAFTIWRFKAIIQTWLWFRVNIWGAPKHQQPTYTKTYSTRPQFSCRVFIPPSYKPDSGLLPLVIDVHGGGFMIGHPILNDIHNLDLSRTNNCCVVSIGYSLAPTYPFPTGVEDCAALIRAVLDDPDLPIDKKKVVLASDSAGGGVSLGAVQLHELYKEVKGIIALYPITNLSLSASEKLSRASPPPGKKDMLEDTLPHINWAYVNPGTDTRNPILSPHFAERSMLPEKLYILGCEHDLLCSEAKDTAEKMAEAEHGEKVVDESGEGWTKGGVRWKYMLGAEHGFPAIVNWTGPGAEKDKLVKETNEMRADVSRWLKAEIFG